MKNYNKSWYSVILSILMVWFMMILVVWVFRLVFVESRDTRWMVNYLKAFAWAEASIELALLEAKNNNYSVDYQVDYNNWKSKVLWEDINDFFPVTDVILSYDLNSASNSVEWRIESWKFKIIPLFWNWTFVKNLSVSSLSDTIVWNILGENGGMSWIWSLNNSTIWNYKTISWSDVSFQNISVWNFLNNNSDSDKMYLILHNTWNSDIGYQAQALWTWEYLTNINTTIVWSGEINWLKQNLRVRFSSWEQLNLLRYSLFSQ